MPRITFKEYRGDRFLAFSAQRDGKRLGYAMIISWIAPNCGAAFARNFGTSTVFVRVTKDAGAGPDGKLLPDVVLFEGQAGRAGYQAEAYKLGRAYLRQVDARGMIERDLDATKKVA